ncbi:MAG TPA: MBL fold metallo-hydrolase [Methanothrix sp.]|jgi:glyoxylase-like metal-dependent hydrolase (beta-lactamase superfamily II)|nr:MBL fold metallo-hydrolase [Methanothrix sp.]HOV81243.1 MBL fold metallo-hydrolase [Methanothrix sp.]HPC88832.1 MBL fold metallo-hydrolase [Methanothrix sp.]HQE87280.1 MBL fold metallo-hydrolase [Methanothrix sp.]HQI67810.1 MBL fold metallo-hydrolase [Methanothrix sp.]
MSGAKAVCSGVYAVGGPGLSSPEDACAYLVDASTSLVLIDAGAGHGINRMEENIRSTGGQPESVWHIIATHCHIDHIGGLFAWKERYGCRIIAHELDRAGIEGERPDLTAAGMYGVDYRPVKVDMMLSGDGGTVRLGDVDFHFLHTPGHTPGSICIYIDGPDGRILFGQDIHGPFSPAWGSDISKWRASMGRLLELKADVLCEGHAGIFRGEKVNRYIESYLKRYER